MKHVLIVCLLAGAASLWSDSHAVAGSAPDRSVSSKAAASPAALRQRIDALFEGYDRPDSPGASVSVYKGGRRVFSSAYGRADLEAGTPMTARAPIHVASVSKQFTAFAVALLAREGRVDLDADVRTYLPWVPEFSEGRITVCQLILHTSGLRDQWSLFTLGGQDEGSRLSQQQVFNMVKRQQALDFKPGTEHSYSNTGYTLLADIVKVVSGQRLREFTAERVFKPLGMTRTFFFDDVTEVVPGRANSYSEKEGGQGWQRELLNLDQVGATSLFTTAEDLARWAGNFTRPVVGDKALIEQITTPGILADGTATDYAFGLVRRRRLGHVTIEHYGADAGFRSLFVYYPAQDFAVAVLGNTPLPLGEKADAIARLYLADAAPKRPLPAVVTDGKRLQALAGLYLPPYEPAMHLNLTDGGLGQTIHRGASTARWVYVLREDDSLDDGEREWEYFKVVRDVQGAPLALQAYDRDGTRGVRYERAPEPEVLTPDQAAAYEGDYRSPELDTTYSLRVDGDGLLVDSIWLAEPVRLRRVAVDRFEGDQRVLGTVVFRRDAQGEVEGLAVHAYGRLRNVKFARMSAVRCDSCSRP